jgi:hypothetical protein
MKAEIEPAFTRESRPGAITMSKKTKKEKSRKKTTDPALMELQAKLRKSIKKARKAAKKARKAAEKAREAALEIKQTKKAIRNQVSDFEVRQKKQQKKARKLHKEIKKAAKKAVSKNRAQKRIQKAAARKNKKSCCGGCPKRHS